MFHQYSSMAARSNMAASSIAYVRNGGQQKSNISARVCHDAGISASSNAAMAQTNKRGWRRGAA